MKNSLKFFEDRGKTISEDMSSYSHKSIVLSIFRFVTFILFVFSIIVAIARKQTPLFAAAGAFFAAFVILCIIHGRVSSKLEYFESLAKVNSLYIARIKGDFASLFKVRTEGLKRRDDIEDETRYVSGAEFYTEDHDYCLDLDLFGRKSLFSLLNVSETAFGRRAFADELLGIEFADRNAEDITVRQNAVKELISRPAFLEQYQATSMTGDMRHDPKALIGFASEGGSIGKGRLIMSIIALLIWIVPIVVLFAASSYIRIAVIACFLVNILLWALSIRNNLSYFKAADGMPSQVQTIWKLYTLLEKADFKDTYLKNLVTTKTGGAVTDSLFSLSSILFFAGLRSQPIFAFLINSVFPIDNLVCYHLGKWAYYNGEGLASAIDNLAVIEVLMCCAQSAFVSKDYSFPVVEKSDVPEENAYFEGVDIAHPLLPGETAVSNSVTIASDIALITGSNMSGKTTLIRTVGVCSLLSYIGAPVPCSSLRLGKMRIMSSMRITDNLGENMSTFKAELIRIGGIIKGAADDNRALLFLIDEIFRGTNSDDRTEGALIVLYNLSKKRICGFMTTHDYAMIDRTSEHFNNVRYYHFSERYTDTEVLFDYVLRQGISRESNARFLMKLVGIE